MATSTITGEKRKGEAGNNKEEEARDHKKTNIINHTKHKPHTRIDDLPVYFAPMHTLTRNAIFIKHLRKEEKD